MAALVVVFAVSNREDVAVSLFPLPYEMLIPKFLLAVLSFVLGAVFSSVWLWVPFARLKRARKRLQKRVETLEQELVAQRRLVKENSQPQSVSLAVIPQP